MTSDIHNITMPIGKVTEGMSLTLTLSGLRMFRVRSYIAMCLIRVAGWVCPIHINIETDNGPQDPDR